MLIVAVIALGCVVTVLVGVLWWPMLVRKAVVVHTVEGQTIKGVSVSRSPLGVTLKHATHMDTETSLAGDVFIPRRQILFVQKVQ